MNINLQSITTPIIWAEQFNKYLLKIFQQNWNNKNWNKLSPENYNNIKDMIDELPFGYAYSYINTPDKEGILPIYLAVLYYNLDLVELLMQYGADPHKEIMLDHLTYISGIEALKDIEEYNSPLDPYTKEFSKSKKLNKEDLKKMKDILKISNKKSNTFRPTTPTSDSSSSSSHKNFAIELNEKLAQFAEEQQQNFDISPEETKSEVMEEFMKEYNNMQLKRDRSNSNSDSDRGGKKQKRKYNFKFI